MDKKKNGAAGTAEDKPVPLAKARPAQSNTPIRPNNHVDRSKASATLGSDKDSVGKTHTSDDAAKAGPQKKRRKVTHACVYCRRSHMTCDLERPCTRCIKRNIGHLCHDEPREHDSKKAGGARSSTVAGSTLDETESQQSQADLAHSTLAQASAAVAAAAASMGPPPFDAGASSAGTGGNAGASSGGGGITAGSLDQSSSLQQLVRPAQLSQMQASGLRNSNMNQFAGFSDAWLTAQNHLQDMQNYQNNYLITPEVSNEFNLLNEFLNSSLLDDGGLLSSGDQNPILKSDEMLPGAFLGQGGNTLLPPSALTRSAADPAELEQAPQPPPQHSLQNHPLNLLDSESIARSGATNPEDKRREVAEFYLQVADPSGNDTPEARMERVLRAKYEAGLLKPFNYIQGYKKLQDYLETHIQPSSKQKILAQINKFRPKFREKVQVMTDLQLVYVEMWFEKTLMEYDRVFASMAVPACCWRRTGEIFRGNKEMAELIGVEVENLRDGKIALHQILTETSMVRYWEEFGTIAFDSAHDTLLTACELKCPSEKGSSKEIKCCFSLKIRRDEAKIPSLIVGNFLPHDPSH